eukprot:gene22269-16264_t
MQDYSEDVDAATTNTPIRQPSPQPGAAAPSLLDAVDLDSEAWIECSLPLLPPSPLDAASASGETATDGDGAHVSKSEVLATALETIVRGDAVGDKCSTPLALAASAVEHGTGAEEDAEAEAKRALSEQGSLLPVLPLPPLPPLPPSVHVAATAAAAVLPQTPPQHGAHSTNSKGPAEKRRHRAPLWGWLGRSWRKGTQDQQQHQHQAPAGIPRFASMRYQSLYHQPPCYTEPVAASDADAAAGSALPGTYTTPPPYNAAAAAPQSPSPSPSPSHRDPSRRRKRQHRCAGSRVAVGDRVSVR